MQAIARAFEIDVDAPVRGPRTGWPRTFPETEDRPVERADSTERRLRRRNYLLEFMGDAPERSR